MLSREFWSWKFWSPGPKFSLENMVHLLKNQSGLETSLVPRPFLYGRGESGEGRKGLVNNSTPTQIHGCIPAVSVDEGKRECQVGVSRE